MPLPTDLKSFRARRPLLSEPAAGALAAAALALLMFLDRLGVL